MHQMTNTEFSKKDPEFLDACKKVATLPYYQEFKPSTRQASKWRNKKGIAYKTARLRAIGEK